MQTKNHKDRFLALGSLIALLIGLLIVVFVVTEILKIIPANYSKFIDAAIIAIISYVVVRIVLHISEGCLGNFWISPLCIQLSSWSGWLVIL